MAADGGTIELEFRARLDKLEADMAGARSKVSRAADDMGDDVHRRLGSKLSGIGGTLGKSLALGIAGAATGVAVGVGALLKGAFNAAEESRKVGAQTNAVIASTGGVANVSAAHVGKYADQLAALTGIDDEVIASGQNMLLTFTNVRNQVGKGNDIFDQGTKAALNMSTALGTDMNQASMLVGKALNDPVAGMTALSRSGIQFTAQQKDQVKAMVAAGDALGAQKIILKELETQFGGSAEAAASPMARLKVVAGNLQEELGARLLPVAGKVAGFLADKLPGAMDKVGGAVSGLFSLFVKGDFTGAMAKAFGVEEDSPVVAKMFEIRDKIIGAFNAVVGWVRTNWPQIKLIVTETMTTIAAVVSGVVDLILTIWRNFGPQIMAVVSAAWEFVKSTITAALDVIQGIVKVVTGIIHGDWSQVWEGIKQILSGAWDFIVARIELAIELAKNILSIGWELIKSAASAAWDGIKSLLAEAWEGIKSKISEGIASVVGFVSELPGKILGALGDLGSMLLEAGRKIMEGLLNGIKAGLGAVKDFVGGIAGKIISWKGPLSYDKTILVPAGRAIMDSLVVGLRDHEGRLVRQLAHVTGLVESVSGSDVLSMAAGSFGASFDVSGMGHSGDAGDSGGSSSPVRPINIGPFYVKEGDLPTEIPRRLRTVLHNWDR